MSSQLPGLPGLTALAVFGLAALAGAQPPPFSDGAMVGMPATFSVHAGTTLGTSDDRAAQPFLKPRGFVPPGSSPPPLGTPSVDFSVAALFRSCTPASGAIVTGPLPEIDAMSLGLDILHVTPAGELVVPTNHWDGMVFSVRDGTVGEPRSRIRDELSRPGGNRADFFSVVDNDVNVGTLAEYRLGAGVGTDNLLGVFAGTGVGAGLILDGKLRQGPRGLAGEIGHIYVAFEDLHTAAVGRGELEDYAGRNALERRVLAADEAEAETLLGLRTDGRLKSKAWAEALDLDDPLARALIDQARSALAAAIATVITLLDVELVVLGGGFAERLGEPFRTALDAEVAERAFAATTAPVVPARLGDTGGALGAALLVEHLA